MRLAGPQRIFRGSPRKRRVLIIAAVCAALLFGLLALRHPLWLHSRAKPAGPPWVYGRLDARFTLVEYADLECPYCREYFPVLRHWVDTHPEVNWQWHHLPLSIHDPAATQDARLAECSGEVGGAREFWASIEWIYRHTRGDGAGLPTSTTLPGMSGAISACLTSHRPDAVISAQVREAERDHIAATPTLRLVDRQGGRTITLVGLVEGDALLSAIDLLAAPTNESAERTSN